MAHGYSFEALGKSHKGHDLRVIPCSTWIWIICMDCYYAVELESASSKCAPGAPTATPYQQAGVTPLSEMIDEAVRRAVGKPNAS